MREIRKNLITAARNGRIEVLVHCCNCFSKQGKGFAWNLNRVFPQTLEADVNDTRSPNARLGGFSSTTVEVPVTEQNPKGLLHIVNLYGQFYYNNNFVTVDYDAMYNGLLQIKNKYSGMAIRFPEMGCGNAGGDWDKVSTVIAKALADEDYAVYKLGRG